MAMDRDRDEVIVTPDTDTEAGRKGGEVAARYPHIVRREDRITDEERAIGEAVYLGLDRVGWGAIWAGFFAGTVTYLLLNVLGGALGVTWYRAGDPTAGAIQTAAMVWLIVTTIIAYFVGGMVTSRMLELPGRGTGAMNGFLYGSFSIVVFLATMLFLPAAMIVPNLGTLFGMLGGLPNMQVQISPGEWQATAWWTLLGLIVALGAATIGGMAGAREAYVDPMQTSGEEAHDRGEERRAA